jgi:co-chaperonin GroES (HSP10)
MSLAKKLIPLLDRVLVEKVAARTKTVGGILLPETASSKARRCTCASAALRPARKRLA